MTETVKTVEEGIERLFRLGQKDPVPVCYHKAGPTDWFDVLETGGKCIPLLKWRYCPPFHTLRENFRNGTVSLLGHPSTIKSSNFAPCTEPMTRLLCREFDLAEFFVDSKIVSVMGYGTEQAANFLCRLENGVMFNLEAAVTMPEDAHREGKHTLFTDNGMISDLAADKMVATDLVHVFRKDAAPTSYDDSDVNLFGLTREEQDICYAAYALTTGVESIEQWIAQSEHLAHLVRAALETLHTGRKYQE